MGETLNRKDLQDFFKSEVKRTLIKQQLRGNPVKWCVGAAHCRLLGSRRVVLAPPNSCAHVLKDENVHLEGN